MEILKLRLLSVIGDNNEISEKELYRYGFNQSNIDALISINFISRDKNNIIRIVDLDYVLEKAKIETSNGNIVFANKYMKICYCINSKDISFMYKMLEISLTEENYELIFNILREMLKSNDETLRTDALIYILILRNYVNIPDDLLLQVKGLRKTNFLLSTENSKYHNVFKENKIRLSILGNKLDYAFKQVCESEQTNDRLTINENIKRKLLITCLNKNNEKYIELSKSIKGKDYKQAQELAMSIPCGTIKRDLIVELINKVLILRGGKIRLEGLGEEPKNFIEAIRSNRFEQAKQMFKKSSNDNCYDKIIDNILDYILELERRIDNDNNVEDDSKKETPEQTNNLIIYYVIKNIIEQINKQDIKSLHISIMKFLKNNNLENYYELMKNMIGIANETNNFDPIIMQLQLFGIHNTKFDYNKYIELFYKSLYDENYQLAFYSFNIIKEYSKIANLEFPLETCEKLLNDLKERVRKEEVKILEPNPTPEDEKIFESLCRIANKENLAIMEIINPQRLANIKYLAMISDDYRYFTIGDDNNRSIVIKYTPKSLENDHFDTAKGYYKALKLMKHKEYYSALKLLENILAHGVNSLALYNSLAFAALPISEEKALVYFTICEGMCLKHNKEYKYIDFLNQIRNKNGIKPTLMITEEDLTANSQDNTDIKELICFINESGMDVESACKSRNMSEEQTQIIILEYASFYFKAGYEEKGNEFIRYIERKDNKSESIKSLLSEIIKEKRLYLHRKEQIDVPLSLKLRPGNKK